MNSICPQSGQALESGVAGTPSFLLHGGRFGHDSEVGGGGVHVELAVGQRNDELAV